jgi:hypothetical protein
MNFVSSASIRDWSEAPPTINVHTVGELKAYLANLDDQLSLSTIVKVEVEQFRYPYRWSNNTMSKQQRDKAISDRIKILEDLKGKPYREVAYEIKIWEEGLKYFQELVPKPCLVLSPDLYEYDPDDGHR